MKIRRDSFDIVSHVIIQQQWHKNRENCGIEKSKRKKSPFNVSGEQNDRTGSACAVSNAL